jgi:iron complex transport system substrate-binding protein
MKKKIYIITVALFFGMMVFLSGCTHQISQTTSSKITVTDTLGRQVEISEVNNKVVAIGPGALRLCCYFNNPDMFVGIEQMEIDSSIGKPYLYANPMLTTLPVVGMGGPNNPTDPEKILAVKPDVIFTTYAYDIATADNLQSKVGIPVIVLSYGENATFDPQVNVSLQLIGKVIGMEKRAEELVGLLNDFKIDLDTRTRALTADKSVSVYIGGLGMKGTHGIESTQGNYALFHAIHATNVVDETGKTGSLMIDKEQLIKWNPDKIFIDGAGYSSILENYKENMQVYDTLSAVKNKQLYLILPYNFYATNIETAIADAYYIGKVLYPEQFLDVEPEKKADEIYRLFLGKEIYEQMAKDFGGFKQVVLQEK